MEDPIVTVKQGRLRGAIKTLPDGSTYYSFKGIPYAQPPVGELRFQPPLPPMPWTDTYEAIEHGPVCPQMDMLRNEIFGDENCLFLNVYTRSLEASRRAPVMVFIHGGAFMFGSGNSNQYGPDFIIQHDVVLVTINYRIEVFGFLCLDTAEVPGNAGMKDQVAALRWVQNNIQQFGGDPDNVTIFGESAGSASVTYHLLSPMSKGLFHKAIAQSGVCTCEWTVAKDAKNIAFRLGKALKINTTDTSELIKKLKEIPAIELINVTQKILTDDEKLRNINILFSPVVEKTYANVVPFITEDPVSVLETNEIDKVPLLIGYNSNEGYCFVPSLLPLIHIIKNNVEYNVPVEISRVVSQERVKIFGDRIKKFFVGDEDFSKHKITEIAYNFGDISFVYPIHRFTHMYSKSFKPLYMYKFSCDTDLNCIKKVMGLSKEKGACHADDIFYMFHTDQTAKLYLEQDNLRKLINIVTKLWTNFAKFGNPTPDGSLGIKWNQYSIDAKEFLNIDEKMSMGMYADRERIAFWDELYYEAGLHCMADRNQQ